MEPKPLIYVFISPVPKQRQKRIKPRMFYTNAVFFYVTTE